MKTSSNKIKESKAQNMGQTKHVPWSRGEAIKSKPSQNQRLHLTLSSHYSKDTLFESHLIQESHYLSHIILNTHIILTSHYSNATLL